MYHAFLQYIEWDMKKPYNFRVVHELKKIWALHVKSLNPDSEMLRRKAYGSERGEVYHERKTVEYIILIDYFENKRRNAYLYDVKEDPGYRIHSG